MVDSSDAAATLMSTQTKIIMSTPEVKPKPRPDMVQNIMAERAALDDLLKTYEKRQRLKAEESLSGMMNRSSQTDFDEEVLRLIAEIESGENSDPESERSMHSISPQPSPSAIPPVPDPWDEVCKPKTITRKRKKCVKFKLDEEKRITPKDMSMVPNIIVSPPPKRYTLQSLGDSVDDTLSVYNELTQVLDELQHLA